MSRSTDKRESAIDAVLDALRRAPSRVTRKSRIAIEAAVVQLLRSGQEHSRPRSSRPGGKQYRIDDLARAAGTTTRNVRAYQERGLLHPPRREGRVAWFDESHLARLKIITSMLGRGYTTAHIHEMLGAWEPGKDLAEVLGLERELVRPGSDDDPVTMPLDEALELAGDRRALDRLVADGLVELDGDRAVVRRPKLLHAFAEMRGYGMPMSRVIEVHERVAPLLEEISRILVDAGAGPIGARMSAGEPRDPDELAEVLAMAVRFRELAMTSVTATLAHSIEQTIKQRMVDYLERLATTVDAGA